MRKKYFYSAMFAIVSFAYALGQVPNLTLLNSYSLTPNTTDTIGAFARIYYHQPRNKFYTIYAARQAGSPAPSGVLSNFAWREYDANMNYTGNHGSLPGLTGAGDFAMVMVDSTYYHLTLASPTANYKITKYDDDFNILSSKTITLNSCSSNIDQLLNYTNGRLIIGAMNDAGVCPPVNPPSLSLAPLSEIHQYDLNLNSIATPTIISQTKITWGSSMIFNAGNYYEVTMENFNTRDLYAYKYDANFTYINKTLLHSDGQWSQGVIWNAGYYYVAHHTGEHNEGNVLIGIYDNNWNIVNTTTVTNFAVPTTTGSTSYNCNRPFLTLVGNKLYVSYDIEKYTVPVNKKDWQAAVKVYQVGGITSVNETATEYQLLIYPNPAKENITIKTLLAIESDILTVRDMLGRIILETPFNNEINVNTASWDKGVYTYQLKNKNVKGKLIIN